MNNDSVNKIVEKIKEENIVPDSKFKVSAKNYIFWVLLIFMAVLGALFFSLAVANLIGVEFFRHFELRRVVRFLILTAPYFWILLFVVAVVLGVISFKKTRTGYRVNTLLVVSVALLAISILSVAIHYSKLDDRIDRSSAKRVPVIHEKLMSPEERRMIRPDEGVIAGRVVGFEGDSVVLQAKEGAIWKVKTSKRTEIQKGLRIEKGDRIIVFGEKSNRNIFEAKIIRHLGALPNPGLR